METKNLDPYQKWETMVDTTSFLGAGALTCALQGVSLIEPTGLGILLTSGASALGIAALSKFLPKDLPFLKVCAAVAAIALTTFSLPFVFAALGTHAFILLTSQTALQLFVINLITKAAAFALFQTSLFFKNYNKFQLPKNPDEIGKLKSSELLEVKNHLVQFPAKAKELPLPYQVSLNKNLKAIGQEQLPLVCYSQVGEEWSKEDVKQLHKEDLSHLTLDQRIEIAELFINHELAPQKRPYDKEEFPKFDSVLDKKKFSQAAADWVSLLLQLDPKAKISPKILKELKIERPAKNDVIVLPPVEKGKGYDYYSIFDWKLAGAGVLLVLAKTAHYVANNSLTEKLPGTALIDLGKTVYEKFTLPKLAVKEITKLPSTALIDLGRTVYEKFTIPHRFRLETLIPAVARPIVSQNIATPVITEIASSSSTYLYAAGLLGLGAAVTAYFAFRKWGQSEPRADDVEPPPRSPNAIVAPVPNGNPPQYIKMEATMDATPVLITHPNDPENCEILHQSSPKFPDDSWAPKGRTIPVSDSVANEFQKLIPPKDKQEASSPRQVVMESVSMQVPKKRINWKAFGNYVERHCPNITFERAKRLANDGTILIQKLMRNEKVALDNIDHKLICACWGLMLHACNKNRPFVEGTLDIKDIGLRIFNFFSLSPLIYQRKSSHYSSRADRHFGIDLQAQGDPLPAGKRTVLFARINTLDGTPRTYLKMENWGANINFHNDKNAWYNSYQVFPHTLEFFASISKKLFPSVFGEVGGGEDHCKEHLSEEIKSTIKALFDKIKEQEKHINPPSNEQVKEYGYHIVIPFFEEMLDLDTLQDELKGEITTFINQFRETYPNNPWQKGGEVGVNDSLLDTIPDDVDLDDFVHIEVNAEQDSKPL